MSCVLALQCCTNLTFAFNVARLTSTAQIQMAGLPAQMDTALLEVRKETEDVLVVMQALLLQLGDSARNARPDDIQKRATAAVRIVCLEPFPLLLGLLSVMCVRVEDLLLEAVANARNAQLVRLQPVETNHAPTAQLALLRQRKGAAHVSFVGKTFILRREVQLASHVLRACFPAQPVEIAVSVTQVGFQKAPQLVNHVPVEDLLLEAVANARNAQLVKRQPVGTNHAPTAQLALLRQRKGAAHVSFVGKTFILRREVQIASHVLRACFPAQPAEIAVSVMQVVFQKAPQLVNHVPVEDLLLEAVANVGNVVQGLILVSEAGVVRIALRAPYLLLTGLRSVLDVLQEGENSSTRFAILAPLEQFRLVETAHVSNAQLAEWHQSKGATHAIFVRKASIHWRPVQLVSHVIQVRYPVQLVEIAVSVMLVVFPRTCQLVSNALRANMLCPAVSHAHLVTPMKWQSLEAVNAKAVKAKLSDQQLMQRSKVASRRAWI